MKVVAVVLPVFVWEAIINALCEHENLLDVCDEINEQVGRADNG